LVEDVEAPVWKTEITAVGDPPRLPCDTLLSTKVVTNFVFACGRSVGIVRPLTKAAELLVIIIIIIIIIINLVAVMSSYIQAEAYLCSRGKYRIRATQMSRKSLTVIVFLLLNSFSSI
jgi:hypothetical protein